MNRRKLPNTRNTITHKCRFNGYKMYFSVGFFENKKIGELFIHNIEDPNGRIDDAGTMLGFARTWALAISLLLQSGYSVEDLHTKFAFNKFGPAGFTDNPEIRSTSSISDYIIRWMLITERKQNVISV